MPVAIGARLGPYEILAPIGAGGMGEVYRAADPRLHREVAIKIAAVEFTERSAREARMVAALNHTNICHIYDVGPDYLVMELVEGPTLAERLLQGPVPLHEALTIARQIADALQAAHDKGIVHRDLKPGNIKLRPDGTVKVLDFGLAKVIEDASSQENVENSPTLTIEEATGGAVMGTVPYMAPEQARGKAVDKRADIWAFGVVLYEMLTGQRLFRGDTVSDVVAAVLTKEPEWRRVPPGTERLLRRCLERDPKERLRDIGDARFLLETDRAPAIGTTRSSLPWKLATAAVAILSIALFIAWRFKPSAAPPPLLRLSVDFGDDAALTPQRGATMMLSPDGSRVVYITGQKFVKARLAVRRLDQPRGLPLAGTEGVEAPFFSPDGKSVAFFADGKLKRIDVTGGAPVTLCDAPSQREGSWGDDDNIIFAATNQSGLVRVSSSGGTPQPVTQLDLNRGDETHRYPQVLPGADAVLFVNGIDYSGEGSIEIQSLKTGERKTLVQAGAYGRYLPSGHLVYYHRGTLFAAPMDARRLELAGPATPLLEDVGFHPGTGTAGFTFSQSGLFAYVAMNPEDQLRPISVIDEKGKTEPLPVPRAKYRFLRLSPDGMRLAVTMNEGPATQIWIYDWATRRFSRLTSVNGSAEFPFWTPDGKYLIFGNEAQVPGPGIYRVRADGAGTPQRLVSGAALIPWAVSTSPARLVYQKEKGPTAGLWTVPLDWSDTAEPKPGTPERLTEGDFAAVSHDGRWLAYVTAQSGTPELFVRPFPAGAGQWQVSTAGGGNPVWSPNGRELFYTNLPEFRIIVTQYSGSRDSFIPTATRVWNPMRVEHFDLMPDGKRVVAVPAADQKEATHATFLLNFIDDLRRRLPPRK